MKLQNFLKQKGQTSVEYLLMIVVSVGLGLTFLKKFEGYMLENTTISMQFYKNLFDPQYGYKKYHLPR